MTSLEPPLPVPGDDPLDAAASAVVDGTATPQESALVAASPEGGARVARMRSVSEAVGRPGPPQGSAAAASAMTAALAAFDAAAADEATAALGPSGPSEREAQGPSGPSEREAQGPSGPGPDGGSVGAEEGGRDNVRVLAPPAGSATARRWLPRLGAVAAVVVLLVAVGVLAVDLLGRGPGSETSQSAEVAPRSSSASGRASGDTSTDRAGPPPPPPQAAPTAPPTGGAEVPPIFDGGSFGNETAVEAIAIRATAALDRPQLAAPPTEAPLPVDIQRCVAAGPRTANEEAGAPLYRTAGTYQGIPALAVAYDRPGDPPRLLLVLARSDCSLLARTAF